MRIANLEAGENWQLLITAEDGRVGLFDVRPFLDGFVFRPLKDLREFRKVSNGGYFVEWECGADLSADTIEARWQVCERTGN